MLMLTAACGNGGDNGNDGDNGGDTRHEHTNDGEVVLRVATPPYHGNIMWDVERWMREYYAAQGITFRMEVTNWVGVHERDAHITRLNTGFMAGETLYDVFALNGHQIYSYLERGVLADINEIIARCPVSSRDDYFTNVLDALEINGGLFTFPLHFLIHLVGINAGLPEDILNRFAQHSSIDVMELMAIHQDLGSLHPEFGNLALSHSNVAWWSGSLHPVTELMDKMDEFVNISTRTSTINDGGFVDFMTNLQNSFDGIPFAMGFDMPSEMPPPPHGLYASQGVFTAPSDNVMFAEALLTLEAPYFTHFIPLANNAGNVRFSNFGAFCITAQGNQDAAWHFLRLLERRMSMDFASLGFIPINVAIFEETTPGLIYNFLNPNPRVSMLQPILPIAGGRECEYNRAAQLDSAMERLRDYLNRPMVSRLFLPMELSHPAFEEFMAEIISAHEAANQIHNRISLWLIE